MFLVDDSVDIRTRHRRRTCTCGLHLVIVYTSGYTAIGTAAATWRIQKTSTTERYKRRQNKHAHSTRTSLSTAVRIVLVYIVYIRQTLGGCIKRAEFPVHFSCFDLHHANYSHRSSRLQQPALVTSFTDAHRSSSLVFGGLMLLLQAKLTH